LVTKLTEVLKASTCSIRLPLRVEGQIALQALQRIKDHKACGAEEQHRHGVDAPGLLLGLFNTATPIDKTLDRTQQRTQRCPFACKHARHIPVEWPGDEDHGRAEQRDLEPSFGGRRKLLEPRWVNRGRRYPWPISVEKTVIWINPLPARSHCAKNFAAMNRTINAAHKIGPINIISSAQT
jgi:hypothetical protein